MRVIKKNEHIDPSNIQPLPDFLFKWKKNLTDLTEITYFIYPLWEEALLINDKINKIKNF